MAIEELDTRLATHNARVVADTVGDKKFQFSLSWDALVDLDLQLQTPQGLCSYSQRKVGGAELDVDRMPNLNTDAPKRRWQVSPVENIVCDASHPGDYACKVVYFSHSLTPRRAPRVPFCVRSRVGPHDSVIHCEGFFSHQEFIICTFTVEADGTVTNFVELPLDKKPVFVNPSLPPPPLAAKAARKTPAPSAKKVAPKVSSPKKAAPKRAPPAKKP